MRKLHGLSITSTMDSLVGFNLYHYPILINLYHHIAQKKPHKLWFKMYQERFPLTPVSFLFLMSHLLDLLMNMRIFWCWITCFSSVFVLCSDFLWFSLVQMFFNFCFCFILLICMMGLNLLAHCYVVLWSP